MIHYYQHKAMLVSLCCNFFLHLKCTCNSKELNKNIYYHSNIVMIVDIFVELFAVVQ